MSNEATAKSLCSVHQAIENRGDLQLEIGNACIACSLNERSELLGILADSLSDTTEPVDSVTALMTLVNERDALLAEVGRLREALERIEECAHGIMPIYRDMDHLREIVISLSDARWTRLYAILGEARAALSGKKEGE